MDATKQIPIVMTQVGDPIAMGFVSNLARPSGNVTGISNMFEQLAAKRLAILNEALPAAKRIAVIFNPTGTPSGSSRRPSVPRRCSTSRSAASP